MSSLDLLRDAPRELLLDMFTTFSRCNPNPPIPPHAHWISLLANHLISCLLGRRTWRRGIHGITASVRLVGVLRRLHLDARLLTSEITLVAASVPVVALI